VVPEYSLSIWHGFNFPLLMSFIALVGGVAVYVNRKELFQFQAQFPENDPKLVFEAVIQLIHQQITRLMEFAENGSLQRYSYMMLSLAMVMMAGPLLDLNATAGHRPQIPVDAISITGAVLLAIGALATVIWNRQRMVALVAL
ncbi:monovalent cation/H+ antiporter subunit A, partial [Oceanospirillum sp. HFRX-1_2]